ncbi:helix-turn-helix domain-containing protein [Hyphomicrobium sp. MC8b]|uniref:helix-turn-helix domain-containing protein n=1 Tax=Hyphomicrobium sp. MC8b TaxID=300273 RepID=UPI00391B3434
MVHNRVREIRKSKKLTLMQAAERIGISHTHLGRIETGVRGLSITMAKQIARGLQYEDLGYLLGLEAGEDIAGTDFFGDAEPYEDTELVPLSPKIQGERWRIIQPRLDLIGLPERAIAFVDTSAEAIASLKGLEKVLADLPSIDGKSIVVVRQFLPPCLLVTNSSGINELPLNVREGDAAIRGVIRAHIVVD